MKFTLLTMLILTSFLAVTAQDNEREAVTIPTTSKPDRNVTLDDDHSSPSSSSSSEENAESTTASTRTLSPTTTDEPNSSSESHSAEDMSSEGSINAAVIATDKPMTECEIQFEKSDECLRSALFIGQESTEIPHTEPHMDSYCDVKKQDFLCIRQYGTKCLKNVPRQIYMSILKNIRIMFKEFCDTKEGKITFLKHLECVEPQDLKILNKVLGRLTNALYFVANNVTVDKMISHACCAVQVTYSDIPIAMDGICSPQAVPEETIEFFRSLIKRTVGDILDIGCGKFQSLEYCQSHLSQGLTDMTNYVDATQLPVNSFMIPLMDFSQKIDGHA